MADLLLDDEGHLTGDGFDACVLRRLGEETADQVHRHLRECARCCAAVERLKGVVDALRAKDP